MAGAQMFAARAVRVNTERAADIPVCRFLARKSHDFRY
jgi:hypothetical protein